MVITLTGNNDYDIQAELNKLISAFVEHHNSMAVEMIDAAEATFQRIYDAFTGISLLSNQKLVVLMNPTSNVEYMSKSQTLLDVTKGSVEIIIVEKKIDKRSGFYKFLKQSTDFREFHTLDKRDLPNWLCNIVAQRGGRLSSQDASLLIERVGVNQERLSNEVDKLLLYEAQITKSTINLLTTPDAQGTLFELLDSAFTGDAGRTIKLYTEQRLQKVEPQQIIAMLAWQIHVFALIKSAGTLSADQIASKSGVNPYVIRKSYSTAKHLSVNKLKAITNKLSDLDVRIKSININPDDALQLFLLKDCLSA